MVTVAEQAAALVDRAYEDPAANAQAALDELNGLTPADDDDRQAMADAGETLFMLADAVALQGTRPQPAP